MSWHLNSDRTVAVSDVESYRPIASCPLNAKVQVLTKGGVHTTSVLKDEKDRADFRGWAPVPYVPESLK